MREQPLKTRIYTENGDTFRMKVEGGLHYIEGNSAPHFSLTHSTDRKGFGGRYIEDSGGAGHEVILEHCPEYADLAALHLSDIDGVPMHAVENGWYWFVGSQEERYGERYHGGNAKGHYGGEYRNPTKEECLEVFARYVRISIEEARTLSFPVEDVSDEICVGRTDEEIVEIQKGALRDAKDKFAEYVLSHRPRWKKEADACIKKHGLKVFGDNWKGSSDV